MIFNNLCHVQGYMAQIVDDKWPERLVSYLQGLYENCACVYSVVSTLYPSAHGRFCDAFILSKSRNFLYLYHMLSGSHLERWICVQRIVRSQYIMKSPRTLEQKIFSQSHPPCKNRAPKSHGQKNAPLRYRSPNEASVPISSIVTEVSEQLQIQNRSPSPLPPEVALATSQRGIRNGGSSCAYFFSCLALHLEVHSKCLKKT